MPLTSRIYLTGFMGSGKSTLGAALSERIGYEWIDLDAEIEKRRARTIADIFQRDGEEAFRAIESEVLKSVCNREYCVFSLGGGVLERPENQECVLRSGALVYLCVGLEELVLRLARIPESRPLLSDLSGCRLSDRELYDHLLPLFESRQATYEQAHITIDIGGLDVSASGEVLFEAVREKIARRPGGTGD